MNNLFFWLSKLAWLLISPGSLLLLFVLLIFILLVLNKQRIAKIVAATLSCLLLIIAFFPVGEWLLYPLESHFPTNPVLPEKIAGIIVLSGAEHPYLSTLWQQVELGDAAERDLAFMMLARQYPEAKLIFTGGTGSLTKQEYKAADVAKELFAQQGFDIDRVMFEKDSRNTYENARYSYKLASPKVNENWILISTAWHMPRSVGIFCKINWPMIPYPVDHQTSKGHLFRIEFGLLNNLVTLRTAIKEWLGLLAYRISGKTPELLPGQCHH